MIKDWHECQTCWAEFKVISDIDKIPEFCPFCGTEIEHTEEELDEEEDY